MSRPTTYFAKDNHSGRPSHLAGRICHGDGRAAATPMRRRHRTRSRDHVAVLPDWGCSRSAQHRLKVASQHASHLKRHTPLPKYLHVAT